MSPESIRLHTKHKNIKSRLAPTPSGYLHQGNALSFLITWAQVRAQAGELLLRIDDLDKGRYRKAYVEDVFYTLDWLGIDYDEGPSSVADFEQNWSQHQRLGLYEQALSQLKGKGLLFACDCTRKKLKESSLNGQYSGFCTDRQLDFEQENIAWRICLTEVANQLTIKELSQSNSSTTVAIDAFVVKQKNNLPAYQLASLIDDTHFGVNYIVRGADLWSSSYYQLYLAKLLGIDSFEQSLFYHHPLIVDNTGQKLSKSKGANALKTWREEGRSPVPIIQKAAQILGFDQAVESAHDLVAILKAS